MSTADRMRDHYTLAQRQAAAMLDAVRNGANLSDDDILWALVTLGESC